MSLPTISYVYLHRDPRNGAVVYVGMGSGHRAWAMSSCRTKKQTYGSRKREHFEWFKELEIIGFTLADLVEITHAGLSAASARTIELGLIKKHGPAFNTAKGPGSMYKPDLLNMFSLLRKSGLSYAAMGRKTKTSTMTAWRYCNAT